MSSVLHIFRAPKKRLPMEELSESLVITDAGLAGCTHARHGSKRQVLLVDRETLEAIELQPGIIRENITTHGLNVIALPWGKSSKSARQNWKSARCVHHAISWKNPAGAPS